MQAHKSFIVIIGGANMDIHGQPGRTLELHDSNPGSVKNSPGGVARNIAENIARLGNDSRLIAPIGRDHAGRMLLQQGIDAGIDMLHIVEMDTSGTSSYLSILDENGALLAAISDMSILEHLGPDQLQIHQDMLRRAALIIIDTNLRADTLAYVMENFSDQPIFVDPVSCSKASKLLPHLKAIHTLKPSLSEAEEIAGLKADSPKQLPTLADWFHQQGVKRMFISLGAKGLFYSTGEGQGQIEAITPSEQIYTNGAGDALLAGLAHAWLRQWPLLPSVHFALSAACLTLSHPATIHPDMSTPNVTQINERHYA